MTGVTTVRSASRSCTTSTRLSPDGRDGNTSGCDIEKPPRYIGWDGSRGETRASCICGRLVSDRRPEGRSRMRREPHVRFREGGGVKFPSATRPMPRNLFADILRLIAELRPPLTSTAPYFGRKPPTLI